MKKKATIAVTALLLVLCFAIGGTLAWLVDESDKVVNTFTYGDINIDLSESENLNLKMIPGNDITKDPKVTVKAGSEACWLFVKVEKSATYDSYLKNCTIDTGWTELASAAGTNYKVYYRDVDADTAKAGTSYQVLAEDKVTVLDEVTKSMMEDIKNGTKTQPTLTFTAYAVQLDGFNNPENSVEENAALAWTEINK